MEKLVDWLGSCSFDDPFFQPADDACRKWIAPYFRQAAPASLEEMTRKEFALRVMSAWRDQHPSYRSVIEAICYELPWTAS